MAEPTQERLRAFLERWDPRWGNLATDLRALLDAYEARGRDIQRLEADVRRLTQMGAQAEAQLAAEREGVKRYSEKWREAEAKLKVARERGNHLLRASIKYRFALRAVRRHLIEGDPGQLQALHIIDSVLAAAKEVTPEFDCAHERGECLGHCSTCGLEFEEGITHECPPGFAAAQEKPQT